MSARTRLPLYLVVLLASSAHAQERAADAFMYDVAGS
jgi:hypothetical protein